MCPISKFKKKFMCDVPIKKPDPKSNPKSDCKSGST